MKTKLAIILLLIILQSSWTKAQNEIHLSTDQPFYFAGQEIKLSLLLVDAITKEKAKDDEVVYIVLKNNVAGNIIEKKIFSKNGIGELTTDIPSNTRSGNYELIAWTNYLKNFGEESYFRKKIPIYSTDYIANIDTDEPEPPFIFNAEGGNLIANVTSRIVYKHNSKCQNKSAILIEDESKEILDITLSENGIGSIIFKPRNDHTYQINHTCIKSKENLFSLPQVQESGYAFSIVQRSKQIQLIVRSSNKSYKNDSIKIVGYQKAIKVFEVKGKINKDNFIAVLNNEDIPSGAISCYLLNENGDIEGSRKLFNHLESITDSLTIDVPTNLRTRQAANIVINNTSENSLVSAYVLNKNSYEGFNTMFEGLNSPPISFSKTQLNSADKKLLDDLMLMSTNETKDLPNDFTPSRYFPKEKYFQIRGRLQDDKPLPDSTTIFFFVPEINVIYQVKVGPSGFFEEAILFVYYGKQEIPFFLMSKDHQFKNPRIIFDDFRVKTAFDLTQTLPWTVNHQLAQSEFNAKNQIAEVYDYYNKSNTKETSNSAAFDISQMLPKPDATFKLNEYVTFGSMEETIKEIVTGLSVRNKKGEKVVRIFEENWLKFYALDKNYEFDETPLILINGRPSNPEQLLALNPADVDEIKLISDFEKLMKHLPFGIGGIVLVKMKDNAALPNIKNLEFFNTVGIAQSQDKENKELPLNVPDMRNVLLWKPYQQTSTTGTHTFEFTTSDRPGDYVVLIEQIDENGNISYATKTIHVSFRGVARNGKVD